MISLRFLAEKAKLASSRLALLSGSSRNEILQRIAEAVMDDAPAILKANNRDIQAGKKKKLSESLLDRLLLNQDRLQSISGDVQKIAALPDPLNILLESRQLPNGLFLKRVRVPLGVIGMIYEARPNVTVDAAAICLKSGNAVILKGGSDAMHSNRALANCIREVLKEVGALSPQAQPLADGVQLIDSEGEAGRKATKELLTLHGLIDVIIPRGGKELIDFVRKNASVPIIETGASVVHTYVHEDADIKKAVDIIMNAKLRRVSICNTLDTLIIHEKIARALLEAFIAGLPKNSYKATRLEVRADSASYGDLKKLPALKKFNVTLKKAHPDDFSTEFLDYILAVRTVKNIDDAIDHIDRHSLKHSEAIITENPAAAEKFLKAVDAACVYWNASTQFSDGAQFGLGAEIGISTQKLHVRGPFALEGLTTYKWLIEGNGQVRMP